MTNWTEDGVSRRAFVKGVAGAAGLLVVGACARGVVVGSGAAAVNNMAPTSPWLDHMGLQLYTVRDVIEKDFAGTLASVAAAGYKEVEPTTYAHLTPAQVRAALDGAGLVAPSTHVALVRGPDLERQLAGYQQIGHHWAATGGADGGGWPPPPSTPDSVKRDAEVYNKIGAAGKPYGVKVLIHNHTFEFEPFADGSTPYDALFAETDPAYVAFEIDLGWARVAGQDPLAWFAKHPHRFPLWHVKDMADLATVTKIKSQRDRLNAAKIVPVGLGDIDYKPYFAHAADAGLEHYYVEQDTAPNTGSLEAIRVSAQNLRRSLG
jgi:sugar phosphate isomerase/epimerase